MTDQETSDSVGSGPWAVVRDDLGDGHLAGRHELGAALTEQVEVPLTLGQGGDTVGRAVLSPDGTATMSVYAPGLVEALMGDASLRKFSVGTAAVSLENPDGGA